MKKIVLMIAVSLVGLLALTACGTTEVTTVMEQQRTLSAAGSGSVYIVPDVAYINVGVRVDADAVSDALAANNIQANAIADALQAMGVEKSDIQTSNFNVYPMQDWGPDGQISRKYYVVENTVMITVRELSKLGQLLDTVVSSGANTINGISFDVQDKSAAEAEARDKAIEDAKAEAQAIAAASGVTLGEIQTVNVYTNGVTYPMYESKGLGGGAAYDASVPVSAGQLKISADANIVFIIN